MCVAEARLQSARRDVDPPVANSIFQRVYTDRKRTGGRRPVSDGDDVGDEDEDDRDDHRRVEEAGNGVATGWPSRRAPTTLRLNVQRLLPAVEDSD
jgi:hypothetical protein